MQQIGVMKTLGATPARLARMLHGLYPTAARLFAEGLAAGALLGALQKRDGERANLQVACDGPIGGILVDADTAGNVRGYVHHPEVHFPGDPARGAHAALGGTGHLTVLRPMADGSYYRSTVQLEAFDLVQDLRRWFASSEQVATGLPPLELYRTLNMGIGMALVVRPGDVDRTISSFARLGFKSWAIGEVVRGRHEVTLL